MKIGILTHYNVFNQGAQLQMSALSHWLEDLGHEVYILTYEKNFDFEKEEQSKNSGSLRALPYYIKHYLFKKGMGLTFFNTRKVMTLRKALADYQFAPYDRNDCDVIVIGSDEVFSIDVGCNKMMYGYGLGEVPAIAYAPSFGRTTVEELKARGCYELVKSGLENMYALSARDLHTQEMICALTGRDTPLVCDPVILYDGHDFNAKIDPIGKRYMVIYAYDSHMILPDEIHAIQAYAKKNNLITVSLGTYHKWCDKNVVCSASEWFAYFKDAACVVTDTFHGSVVAMKNHSNVAVFIRESINAFKLRSLLEETGMTARLLETISLENLESVLSQKIDYADVDTRMNAMAERSGHYLKEALERIHE